MKSTLEEKQKQLLIDSISETVESCPNPDLAKSILAMSRYTPSYLSTLHQLLGVAGSEVAEVVPVLENAGLVSVVIRDKDAGLIDLFADKQVEHYLCSEKFYGKFEIFARERVERDVALNVMDVVKGFVNFNYSKEFTFPLASLEELRDRSQIRSGYIRDAEIEHFYEQLGVPREFSGFPSFVRDVDPTTSDDGYKTRTNKFCFHAKFDSPKQAFETGFDNAYGTLVLSSATHNDKSRGIWHCLEVKRNSDVYDIVIQNIRYQAREHTIPLQREIQKGLNTIQERVSEVLGN